MPKKIAPEVKEKAMELYLQGDLTAKEISEELQRIYKADVKVPTIYAWSREAKWNDKQVEARAVGMEQVQESESARFARLQKEHLNTYEKIRHQASHDLEGLTFDRAIEAVRDEYIGVQGERDVMEGMINLQFVQDVLAVIVEEVGDPDILGRVALRLKTLVQSQD